MPKINFITHFFLNANWTFLTLNYLGLNLNQLSPSYETSHECGTTLDLSKKHQNSNQGQVTFLMTLPCFSMITKVKYFYE